jgi:Uma2 family endonuclease
MSALQILPHYSFEDWEQWEGKWEIIHGIPYAMSPAPVPKHQVIANALGAEFHFALKNCRNCKVMQPVDYKIEDDIVVQPDLLIVCKPILKSYLDFPPSLVAEILSPATALKDRHTKYQLYQEQKVKYYIIISPETEEVEIFENTEQNFKLVQKGNTISHQFSFTDECSAEIDFAELWK